MAPTINTQVMPVAAQTLVKPTDPLPMKTGPTEGGPIKTQMRESSDTSEVQVAKALEDEVTLSDAVKLKIHNKRQDLHAIQAWLISNISSSQSAPGSQSAANERIADADSAMEAALASRSQMLEFSASAVSAQANTTGENVIQLLGSL